MSAALQNSNNWPGIMRAAEELRAQQADLEEALGFKIGPVEVVSKETAERSLREKVPETIQSVMHATIERHLPPDYNEQTLGGIGKEGGRFFDELDKVDTILLEANQYSEDHPRRRHLFIRAGKALLKKLGASLFVIGLVAPTPQMQLQRCTVRTNDSVMVISCDSSKVCPKGYALDTWLDQNPDGSALSSYFGYGTNAHNSCQPVGKIHSHKIMEVLP